MKKPMQKIRTCLQKTPNALFCVLGAVVFLAGFYFLCYRTPLNEVWLPTTMNNDEALYNRQVVSVLTHGGPQGYFGYQESTADIGRYGTWGPLLIWAYALPGLLFGASVNVVLWCNLLLIAVGIAVFARCARLNYWQCIALCGALFSIMLPLRSCVSGASEAMHYMLALLIVGTAAALHRSGKTGWLIACAAACAVETIFRPYALLFWVFPLTAVWQNKRRRAACLGTAAGGFAVSLFAMAKLAAPYFSDGGMDFDGIRLLLQLHPVAAVRYECARAAALLHAAWRDDILPTLHGETTYIGGGCVTFLAVVLVAVVCLVWDKHKGRPLVLKGCALFCSAVIALVLLFMYNIDPRHMMLLAILLLGTVVVEDAAPAAVWLPVLVVNSYFAARRFIVDEMLRYEHCYPYVIGLVLRSTKRICNVPVHHRAREEGRSGYTLSKLLNLWMNGFTSFSVKPLRIATYIGTLFAVAGFLYFIYIIIDHFTRAAAPIGWASTTALLLLLGGMILVVLGIMGEYVGRIYMCANAAPQYVEREVIRHEENDA